MSILNRLSYRYRSAAAGLALGFAGVLASPAAGQLGGGAALADLPRPDYVHRDMQIFSQGLSLDDGQRMILDALFQDYFDSIDNGWKETQARMQELITDLQALEQQRDQRRVLEAVIAPFDEWRVAKERLKERFEGDVRAILNPEQGDRWPQFMQQMRREKTLHMGLLSGESLNLFHHVRDLRMDDRAHRDVEPLLDQYSHELDQALKARNEILDREGQEFIHGLRTQGNVPAPKYIRELVAARARIRDVNLRYIDEIAERLPAQHAESFRSRASEAAFPRIYRQLPAMRMISRALEIEDLDEDIRETIKEIRDTFLAEIADLNEGIRLVTIEFEPRQLRNREESAASRHTGVTVERIDDATRPGYIERDERAQYYVQLVQGLLGPEHMDALPGGERRISGRESREGGAIRSRSEDRPAHADPRGGRPIVPARPERGSDREAAGERGGERERGGARERDGRR